MCETKPLFSCIGHIDHIAVGSGTAILATVYKNERLDDPKRISLSYWDFGSPHRDCSWVETGKWFTLKGFGTHIEVEELPEKKDDTYPSLEAYLAQLPEEW